MSLLGLPVTAPTTTLPGFMYPMISTEDFIWDILTDEEISRLHGIGCTVSDFLRFRSELILSPFDFVYNAGAGFRSAPRRRPLRNDDLLTHLEGRTTVSTRCERVGGRLQTRWLWFDLDSGPTLDARYDRLRRALPVTPLVFRSSSSGGLHCLFRLEEPAPLFVLNNQDGCGLVPRVLAAAGLRLERGELELYPQPFCQPWRGNAIRAPFGPGSFLLCPDELMPLHSTPAKGLTLFSGMLADGKLDTLTLSELVELGSGPMPAGARRRPRSIRQSAVKRRNECTQLETVGLTGPSQLNSALFEFSLNHAKRATEREEARALLHGWLDDRHNGHSRTYNRSARNAHREADSTLDRTYDTYKPSLSWINAPGLSLAEVTTLDASAPAGPVVCDEEGVAYPRLKYFRYMFAVLNGMKQWVLTRSTEAARHLTQSSQHLLVGSQEFDEAFIKGVRSWWPDPQSTVFRVDSPYNFRTSISGVSIATSEAFWRIARASGQFPLARCASAWGGRSAAYDKTLNFSSPLFPLLELALATAYDRGELVERYGEHGARCVRKAEEPANVTRSQPPDGAERYARTRLGYSHNQLAVDSPRPWLARVLAA